MSDRVFTITHSPEGIRLMDGGGTVSQWSTAIHLAETHARTLIELDAARARNRELSGLLEDVAAAAMDHEKADEARLREKLSRISKDTKEYAPPF